MFTPENKKLLEEWPLILAGIIREREKKPEEVLSATITLIKNVQEAQRNLDAEQFLPFEDEKKVELRKDIAILLEQIQDGFNKDDIRPEILGDWEKFIKEKLTF